MSQESKTTPTTNRHDLDDASLGKYLLSTNAIPNLALPLKSTKIGYGQSNPTYFVDDARFVLLLLFAACCVVMVVVLVVRETISNAD